MPCAPILKRSPALPLIPNKHTLILNSCSCYWTTVYLCLYWTIRKGKLSCYINQDLVGVGDNYVSDLSVIRQWSNERLSTDQLPDYWPIDYSSWLPILEQNSTNIATDMLNDSQLRSLLIHQSTPPVRHTIPADGILKCSTKATNTIVIYG